MHSSSPPLPPLAVVLLFSVLVTWLCFSSVGAWVSQGSSVLFVCHFSGSWRPASCLVSQCFLFLSLYCFNFVLNLNVLHLRTFSSSHPNKLNLHARMHTHTHTYIYILEMVGVVSYFTLSSMVVESGRFERTYRHHLRSRRRWRL